MDNFTVDIDNMESFTSADGPIIVVDDDPAQLAIVKTCYQKAQRQNELLCFLSADELFEYLDKVVNNLSPMPEIVLLDINMPGKDGFTTLKEIRENRLFRLIPIIMMFTSSDSSIDKEQAKKLNANAFLSKPSSIKDYIKFFKLV